MIGPAGDVLEHAMGQVATMSQVHAQDGIAGFQHGKIDRRIGLSP